MKNKKLWISGIIGMFIFIAIGWGFFIYQGKQNLPVSCGKEDVIRLHVLANSDSAADQQLKLKVRDAIIAYLAPYLEQVSEKDVARSIVLAHQNQLLDVATQVLVMNGADYSVVLETGIYDFPIKSYGNLVLPAGKYEAVRVLIGQAEGKNWWCVLFPPLCFVDITNATAIPAQGLADSNQDQTVQIEFRSKIAELWREHIQ